MKPLILSLLFLLLAPLALVGCASTDQKYRPMAQTQTDELPAKVVLYRGSSLQASLAKAYVGVEEGYFSTLDENQYIEFPINPGFHTFKARAHGSVGFSSTIKAMPGETLCIEARPNLEELEWLVVPFLNAFIPSFVLEETVCPSSEELSKFTAM